MSGRVRDGAASSSLVAGLVASSRTLFERLAAPGRGPRPAGVPPATAAQIQRRLAQWRAAVGQEDPARFARRLAWAGWSAADAAHAVAGALVAAGAVPGWAETFVAAYGHDARELADKFAGTPAPDRASIGDRPVPFEELLAPLLRVGRARVAGAPGLDRLATSAVVALERDLLCRLGQITCRALYAELSVCRTLVQQSLPGRGLALGAGNGRGLYRAFLDRMVAGGLLEFFARYPVAARLVATVVDLWVDAVKELAAHLAADADALAAELPAFQPGDQVVGIETGAGDTHAGGRSVAVLALASGGRLVYKPRSLGLERFFAELVAWVNARSEGPALTAARVLDRPTHGWMEFIEHRACARPDEVARFYERSGMLLALTYALGGADFHYENLIAAGEHPVLIDLEALLGHRFALAEPSLGSELHAPAGAQWAFDRSVLKVLLLPWLKLGPDGQAVDMGGLSGSGAAPAGQRVPAWLAINTDAMRLGSEPAEAPETRNLPRLAGEVADAAQHVEAIVAGFCRCYRLLVRHRSELLGTDGLLRRLAGQPARYIFRHTSLYAGLLERALHPKYLRDGVDQSLELEVLCRPLLGGERRPPSWPLVAAEIEALGRMDLPLFAAPVDAHDLRLPSGEVVAGCFEKSAYAEAVERIESFNEADVERQVELIRAAFAAKAAAPLAAVAEPPAAGRKGRARARLAYAIRVAERLYARRTAGTGAPSWLGASYVPSARRYVVGPLGAGLLDGAGGIALFFAALARRTGDARWRARALAVLRPLRAQLADPVLMVSAPGALALGAGTGVASVILGFVQIAALLDEPALIEDAARLAQLITPAALAAERSSDVLSGHAGALLAALALARAGVPEAGTLARACGEALLGARVRHPGTGRLVWMSTTGEGEVGVAHGQAGAALALLALARAWANDDLVAAAREAMAHERLVAGPDLAAADNRDAAWSRGAVGIGLARLATLDVLDDPEVRADIEAALTHARDELTLGSDNLCCGTAARLELLLLAGRRLARPALTRAARAGARALLARASAGQARLGWRHGYQPPGLFQGEAGIAYQLLRIGAPERLPALLEFGVAAGG